MPRSAQEIVERLVRAGKEQDYATTIEVLSKNCLSRVADGRIYIGHRGVSEWIRDFAREHTAYEFTVHFVRELEHGFVVVGGTEFCTNTRGETEAVPGTWLHHVQDGVVTAVVHFRTEGEAIRAATGPGRGENAIEVIESHLDAYNRRDLAALISQADPEIRFSSSVIDPATVQRGLGALARLLAQLDGHYEGVLVEAHQLSELGDGFVLVEAVVRIDSDDLAETQRHDAVWLARVDNGQVAEFILHDDVESARAEAASRVRWTAADDAISS